MDCFFHLKDKIIVITGASSGIGRQCAILCSRLGASVALIGRNERRLEETYAFLDNGSHCSVRCDITQYAQLETLVGDIVAHLGRINGFVHAAGVEMTKPFRTTTPTDYEHLFATNVIAGFELARIIAGKKNTAPEGASFVFVGSVMSTLGQPGKVGYCASKGALVPGVKAMALECAPRKIRVNCVLPGIVETEMVKNLFESIPEENRQNIISRHPLGLGQPEDIANVCAYLLSDLSRWITGTTLTIDGGYSAS